MKILNLYTLHLAKSKIVIYHVLNSVHLKIDHNKTIVLLKLTNGIIFILNVINTNMYINNHTNHLQFVHSLLQHGLVPRSDSRRDLHKKQDLSFQQFRNIKVLQNYNQDTCSPLPLPRPLPRPRPAFGQFLIQWPVRPQPKHSLLLILDFD